MLMADEWYTKGCEACRTGVLSAAWPPPEHVAENIAMHADLHHCNACGAYWIFNEREAHVISEYEARADFPHAFA